MGSMNILYCSKSIIKDIISKTFERVYNQLPLYNVNYPFAVFESELRSEPPGVQLEILIDLWDDSLGLIEFNQKADTLINSLDRINNLENNGSIHFAGQIEVVRDVPTQEESLNRIQIIGLYDVYKSN